MLNISELRIKYIKYKCPYLFEDSFVSLIMSEAIGDRVFIMSYLNEVAAQHPGKKVRIVCSDKNPSLIRLYKEYYDDLVVCDRKTFELLQKGDLICGDYRGKIIVCHVPAYFKNSYKVISKYPSFNMFDFIKYCMLDLNKEAKQVFPILDCRIKANMIEGKYVVVCPDAVSLGNISEVFWLELIEKLNDAGFKTFVNTLKTNTKYENIINSRLEDLIPVAVNATAVIGLRSGLLDFLSIVDTNIIALYPSDEYFSFFDMSKMNPSGNIIQMIISDTTIDDIMGRLK